MALLQRKKPEYKPVILKARNFLINQQHDFDSRGKTTMFSTGGLVMAPDGLTPISPILTSQWKRSSTPRK